MNLKFVFFLLWQRLTKLDEIRMGFEITKKKWAIQLSHGFQNTENFVTSGVLCYIFWIDMNSIWGCVIGHLDFTKKCELRMWLGISSLHGIIWSEPCVFLIFYQQRRGRCGQLCKFIETAWDFGGNHTITEVRETHLSIIQKSKLFLVNNWILLIGYRINLEESEWAMIFVWFK